MIATIDLAEVKTKMKATWESGDYAAFATYMEPGAVDLLETWDVRPDERFLDVACGAGQLAIPAARMGIDATGVDIAENLVAKARERAATEGSSARFDQGDAEALPYEDASFDVVASLFGAMFAPRPDRVAAELLRVCRPGGRILMGNWTPESFPATMFRTVSRFAPPPADIPPATLWGQGEVVRARFEGAAKVQTAKRFYSKWEYPFSLREVVDFFSLYFGPIVRANARLSENERSALHAELVRVFAHFNRGTNGTTILEGEFLDVRVVR